MNSRQVEKKQTDAYTRQAENEHAINRLYQHASQKKEKIREQQELRQQTEANDPELTFKPQINKLSATKKSEVPSHLRLHENAKVAQERRKKLLEEQTKPGGAFVPVLPTKVRPVKGAPTGEKKKVEEVPVTKKKIEAILSKSKKTSTETSNCELRPAQMGENNAGNYEQLERSNTNYNHEDVQEKVHDDQVDGVHNEQVHEEQEQVKEQVDEECEQVDEECEQVDEECEQVDEEHEQVHEEQAQVHEEQAQVHEEQAQVQEQVDEEHEQVHEEQEQVQEQVNEEHEQVQEHVNEEREQVDEERNPDNEVKQTNEEVTQNLESTET